MSSKPPRKRPSRNLWVREQESRPCRRCGAEPGQQCAATSGARSSTPHAERFNDARRAAGETGSLQVEGLLTDRSSPPDAPPEGRYRVTIRVERPDGQFVTSSREIPADLMAAPLSEELAYLAAGDIAGQFLSAYRRAAELPE